MAGKAREVRNVGRMVGRQAKRAHPMREAQSPEMLHRARLRCIGLRIERGAGLAVDQQAADAAPPEFVGQHQAAGAATRDQHVDLQPIG